MFGLEEVHPFPGQARASLGSLQQRQNLQTATKKTCCKESHEELQNLQFSKSSSRYHYDIVNSIQKQIRVNSSPKTFPHFKDSETPTTEIAPTTAQKELHIAMLNKHLKTRANTDAERSA